MFRQKLSGQVIDSLPDQAGSPAYRIGWLKVFLYGTAMLLAGRSFYLQVWLGDAHQVMAENNRVTRVVLAGGRGLIHDRFGLQLVENIASTDVVLDPALLPPEEHEAVLIDRLPQLLELSPEETRGLITEARGRQRVVPLKKAIDHDLVIALEGEINNLPGVRLMSTSVRSYPYSHAAAGVIGYTGPVTVEEVAENPELLLTDFNGRAGIEKNYDEVLKGKPGAAYVEVDAEMRIRKEVRQEEPVPGNDLELTLDIEMQQFIFNLLADRVENPSETDELGGSPQGAAAVAMDPRNGEILALVTYPGYDPNSFSQPAQKENANIILTDKRRPLFNRAVGGTYPPGSTIKPFLAAAGLEEGVISEDTLIMSTGGIRVGQWSFPDWRAGGHGLTDVQKAIADSVNTFFYILVGGDEERGGMGVKKTTKYLTNFGWGRACGIDLPGEADGFLPSPEWKQGAKGERWYIGDDYHLGIGQGDVLITPLQLAQATGAIANGGRLYRPHLATDKDGQDFLRGNTRISPKNLKTVAAGMRQTVTDGSGRSLLDLETEIAGKTGTAQTGNAGAFHAWFTSFGPYNKPELVLTVLVEEGGSGDKTAVPIAREIWQWWIENRRGKEDIGQVGLTRSASETI